ncbi:DMT family transporter [Mycobacterium sp. 2YAF39]|uniref:DMT family transporter n=1 Tax=Mycobacterium sp. 2YAF39 TaxID=3233033 RepID=UPI003F9D5672
MHAVVVLLALLAAFCMAVGMVNQHRATTDVPTERGMTSDIAVAMARSPLWWAGMLTTTLGYGFQVLALAWGSLLVVQPLLVSCLLFALPMSARLGQRKVTTSEWTWALVLTGALGVFILLARPKPVNRPPMLTWTTLALVLLPILGVCVVVAARSGRRRRAALLSIVVAVLIGIVAVLTKVCLDALADGGLSAMFSIPAPYALVLLTLVATVLKQSAFNAGALQVSVPTILAGEQLVAVALGLVILGEDLALSLSDGVVIGVAIIAMISATIALGRREGAVEAELDAAAVRSQTTA